MNKNQFLKSLIYLFFSLLLTVIISYLLNNYTPLTNKNWWISLIFFGCIFLILNYIYNFKYRVETFSQLLLGSLIVKLLLALIIILIYRLLQKSTVYNFAMHFLIHYFVFTVFEMNYLLKLIKQKSNLS